MRINNFTEFSNFLQIHGFANIGQGLANCVNQFSVICTCKPDERQAKLDECNRIYSSTIKVLSQNKAKLFNTIKSNKIEFFSDGKPIGSILK